MVYRSLPGQSLIDKFISFVDAIGNFGDDRFFAIEARHRDILVSSDDNTVSRCNFSCCQDILGTAGSVRFDLNRDTAFFGMLLQTFGSHEGMCDACRAGCYSQNLDMISGRCCRLLCFGSCWCCKGTSFFGINEF